jgi:hypothetical protein
MIFTTVENLRWSNDKHCMFDCDVFFVGIGEKVPYACVNGDPSDHAKEIWRRALAGEFGPIAEALPQPPEDVLTGPGSALPSGEIPGAIL